jgi:hypothetical protein
MRSRPAYVTTLLLLALAAACDEPADPLGPDLSHGTVGVPGGTPDGWDLPLMGTGVLARAFPGEPCMEPLHRQFDFWVGEWNVYNTAENLIGTNVVTSELDGCLVQEHWISTAGFRGRSLNSYDAETGLWHQDWVSQTPIPNGITVRLRTSGGLDADGDMVLDGVRNSIFGIPFLDHWRWSLEENGNVIQSSRTRIPAIGFDGTFTGVYVPGTPTPIAEQATPFCQAGQAWDTRAGDFLVGSYTVSGDPGPELGAAVIETDLSDCVFVEHFESRGGLRAISFTYYDAWVESWFRIYVDSEGERLVLRGGFDGASLVLEGTEGTAAGDVEVRVRWTPDGADVLQSWAVSRDDGASWTETAILRYRAD